MSHVATVLNAKSFKIPKNSSPFLIGTEPSNSSSNLAKNLDWKSVTAKLMTSRATDVSWASSKSESIRLSSVSRRLYRRKRQKLSRARTLWNTSRFWQSFELQFYMSKNKHSKYAEDLNNWYLEITNQWITDMYIWITDFWGSLNSENSNIEYIWIPNVLAIWYLNSS